MKSIKSYNNLEKEFKKNVKELQKICPHKKLSWCQEWYRIGASTGRELLICNNCNKVVDTRGEKFLELKGD